MNGGEKIVGLFLCALMLAIVSVGLMITLYQIKLLETEAEMIEQGMTASELKCIRHYNVACPEE